LWIDIWVLSEAKPTARRKKKKKRDATSTTSPSGRQLGVLHTYMWGEEERLIELWGV
jgi:hypothetical protein